MIFCGILFEKHRFRGIYSFQDSLKMETVCSVETCYPTTRLHDVITHTTTIRYKNLRPHISFINILDYMLTGFSENMSLHTVRVTMRAAAAKLV